MAVIVGFYNKFIEYVGDGGIDLDNDTFKMELYNSNHQFTAVDDRRSQIQANSLATANGYTSPGKNLTSVTWIEAAGTLTFDAADTVLTASGGIIGIAGNAVIYSDTATVPAADLLMCSINFDGNQSAGDTTDFKIIYNASGIFTIS